MSEGIEDQPSAAASEGTDAHKIFEEMTIAYFTEKPFDTSGLSQDMVNGASLALNEVIKSYTEGSELFVEERINLAYLHKDMFGTSDVIIKHPDTSITIIDYKYGKWPVDPYENSQLMYYFLGARNEQSCIGGTIKIVQPRSRDGNPIKSSIVTREDYLRWEETFKKGAALVDLGTPLVKGDWCRFCLGKTRCPLIKT